MKKNIYTVITLLMISVLSFAQTSDISVSAGVNVPIYKDIESDATLNVTYGRFNNKGYGFRIGARWNLSTADIDHSIGIPIAFGFRTRTYNTSERIESGVTGAMDAMKYGHYSNENNVKNAAGGFLMNLFSDMEFFIGLTPGYVAGTSSFASKNSWGDSWQYWEEVWTEKKNSFSLSADAGMCLNYCIWKFDIKIMPAFHYYITENYIIHRLSGEDDTIYKRTDKPLRWFFSLNGGLAFRF